MRVLVLTSVHNPQDSRIRARQIRAMLDAGWTVTYAASFRGWDVTPEPEERLTTVDIARAVGRRRLNAYRSARRTLRTHGPDHDLILLHDPELLLAARGLRLPPVVWDVHEDTAAAVLLKPWLPRAVRALAARQIRRTERWAEEHLHLILAEHSYQARFSRLHPVVPNSVRIPAEVLPSGSESVVYIGSLTAARGARELIRLGQALRDRSDGALVLRLVGAADPETEPYLRIAVESGTVRWDGFLPPDQALGAMDGALAGVCLLHDTPNYRISMPTKVLEYMAHGIPVITTPLPLAAELIESAGAGIVVPFGDVPAAAQAVLALRDDPGLRARMGAAGRSVARQQFDWSVQSERFLAALTAVVGEAPGT